MNNHVWGPVDLMDNDETIIAITIIIIISSSSSSIDLALHRMFSEELQIPPYWTFQKNQSSRDLSNLSTSTYLSRYESSKPEPSSVLSLTCHPGHSGRSVFRTQSVLWFHYILSEQFNFPLEVPGAVLCGYNFKLLSTFFFSQKEALERARLQEKTPQPRSSDKEDSLVRRAFSEKLLINLMCLLWRVGGCCLYISHFHRKAWARLIQYSRKSFRLSVVHVWREFWDYSPVPYSVLFEVSRPTPNHFSTFLTF